MYPENSSELHVFCDDSSKAYGAVVYLHNTHSKETALVMSKSRLTPNKTLTIPRAELLAALLRLIQFVHASLAQQLSISKCILWSDSQIVLHWIQSHKKLPCFVQNRINEIRANAIINDCPTADNPADMISRGIDASHLMFKMAAWRQQSRSNRENKKELCVLAKGILTQSFIDIALVVTKRALLTDDDDDVIAIAHQR
jgi:hypothetical protein